MKAKTALYAALGFVTYRVGKIYARRRGKQMLKGERRDERTDA